MNRYSLSLLQSRKGIPLLVVLVLALSWSTAASADPVPPFRIQQIGGGGQIITSNALVPRPLVARVTDANGDPVPGIQVHFAAPHCPFDGTACLLSSAYPYFPSHAFDVVVVSDDHGMAVAPTIHAGNQRDITEDDIRFAFEFEASIDSGVPTSLAIERATFVILQTNTLNAIPIGAAFTGSWYDPAQSGHGLTVEVLPDNRVLVYWNSFTPDGSQQAWFTGVGEIMGNQAVVYAQRPTGARWIPNFDRTQITKQLWGTLTLTFTDCDHGRVDFSGDGGVHSEWGIGHMDLTRLTLPAGLSCP